MLIQYFRGFIFSSLLFSSLLHAEWSLLNQAVGIYDIGGFTIPLGEHCISTGASDTYRNTKTNGAYISGTSESATNGVTFQPNSSLPPIQVEYSGASAASFGIKDSSVVDAIGFPVAGDGSNRNWYRYRFCFPEWPEPNPPSNPNVPTTTKVTRRWNLSFNMYSSAVMGSGRYDRDRYLTTEETWRWTVPLDIAVTPSMVKCVAKPTGDWTPCGGNISIQTNQNAKIFINKNGIDALAVRFDNKIIEQDKVEIIHSGLQSMHNIFVSSTTTGLFNSSLNITAEIP